MTSITYYLNLTHHLVWPHHSCRALQLFSHLVNERLYTYIYYILHIKTHIHFMVGIRNEIYIIINNILYNISIYYIFRNYIFYKKSYSLEKHLLFSRLSSSSACFQVSYDINFNFFSICHNFLYLYIFAYYVLFSFVRLDKSLAIFLLYWCLLKEIHLKLFYCMFIFCQSNYSYFWLYSRSSFRDIFLKLIFACRRGYLYCTFLL